MNILITGAFGFIGTNLSKSLKQVFNCRLIAVDNNQPVNSIADEYYSWNELEQIDWNTIDAVIHLAGKAHDTKNTTEEKAYFDINVGLTQKIFEYFLQSNATKFIFFSSVKAVADSVTGEQLKENDSANPLTAYGKSKLAAEQYILKRKTEDGRQKTEDGSFQTSDKKVFILRPCMNHGPGNKGNLNLLYQAVKKGSPWPLGAFENQRSMVSIDNLSWVIAQLIEKDIEPGIYQMADDEPLSTNEIIELISESLGRKPQIWHLPKGFIKALAKTCDVLHLPLTSERLKKLTESYVVSNAKLKKALGIEHMPITDKEGMRRTLKSF